MTINFIDVFAGCGGLSLGLSQAGCKGIFAVEKSPLAFETLKHNLINGKRYKFNWPSWLPVAAMTCETLTTQFQSQLASLQGSIDLIVGGPPCQGFSTAGKRNPDDPRNSMTEEYLKLVKLVSPQFIAIENVSGYNMQFREPAKNQPKYSYADYISSQLEALGYDVSRGLVNCSDFGVPQNRQRYIILCSKSKDGSPKSDLFEKLTSNRESFLKKLGLPKSKKTTVEDAISDLETANKELVDNTDSGEKNFKQLKYLEPKELNPYLKLMRNGALGIFENSLRLTKHRPKTIEYFKKVQTISRAGFSMSTAERKLVETKKHSTTVLNKNLPAPTITTLPDDIIHYSEPRILTARENARLQSFPDWFEFKGKYTTGGVARKNECPRYTQIGNAVPPLLAQAIGITIQEEAQNIHLYDDASRASSSRSIEVKEPQFCLSDPRQ
ncbi:DNA cytosine methyltransferase [Pseudomonas asplenii]|uniref:DNA cytosine methyltransferase n=1 Tax=Pseudomonas asplenii TaxID=53407 RepID=UPI002360C715|nr:DNA cytosine methyltransferase [Pseudomonas asplenii]